MLYVTPYSKYALSTSLYLHLHARINLRGSLRAQPQPSGLHTCVTSLLRGGVVVHRFVDVGVVWVT